MEKFNRIIASIKNELQELEQINESLTEENLDLRKRLKMYGNKKCKDLSLEEAFEHFYLKSLTAQKIKAFNCLKYMGVNYVSDFYKIDTNKVLNRCRKNYISAAIIIVLMEYYGISFEYEELKNEKLIGLLKEKIAKIQAEIEFI